MKLLLAPKKQGIVTSYRTVKKLKKQREPEGMQRSMLMTGSMDTDYESVQVPEHKKVTYGVDIAKLADWLEEDATGQRRLPNIG